MPHPKVKIADNSGNEVAVTSNALDVNIAGGASIDIGDVDMFLDGGTALLGGAGAVAAGVLRVTLASDDPAVTALQILDNAISGSEMQVDVVTLPASTNTIEVVGDAAEDAAVAGNPVLVGGRYDSSDRTLDDGDVGAIALSDEGFVKIDWNGDVTDNGTVIQYTGDVYNTTDRGIRIFPAVRSDTLAALANVVDGDWTPTQVNAEGALYTTHGITGGADGVTTVTNAGTDVTLASSTACKKVDIQAQTDNTGLISVGFTGVDAAEATGTGVILYAGDTYSLEINNLNLVYIDSTVSGEGVRYTYFT
jgi:hypothetical protein